MNHFSLHAQLHLSNKTPVISYTLKEFDEKTESLTQVQTEKKN